MISVGSATIASSTCDFRKVVYGEKTLRVLCIGHGGGSLPLFLPTKEQRHRPATREQRRRPGSRGARVRRRRDARRPGRRPEDVDQGRGRRWIREDDEVEAGGVRGRRRRSGGATMRMTMTADRRLEEDDWCE
ncbi:hypothetical protein Syun_025734 [Stephania yunnanensis]|uniref:Uncharacterized protein n=1 Tax=Stephania yunnanensis TaxID=152371 RepID=A0AAP0ESP9_9MAGN